ncbi:MAG: hypothetical protein ACREDO_09500 [Methyloceanibacter sp.]
MTKLLYWLVYYLDLGKLGPKVLDFAVRSWLKHAQHNAAQPLVRHRTFGFLPSFDLHARFSADERM